MAEENQAPNTQEAGTVEKTPFERAVEKLVTPSEELGESQESTQEEATQETADAQGQGETQEQAATSSEQQEQPAQEEVPLRARQLAILERKEREYREKYAQLEQTAQQKAEEKFKELVAQLQTRPEILKEHGVADLGLLAGQLWNLDMGEDAPQEFRDNLQFRQLQAEISALKAQLEERAKEPPQPPQQLMQVAGEIRGFLQAIPDDMPMLKREFETNPQETLQVFGQLGDLYIANGQYPSAKQIAQDLETQMRAEAEQVAAALGYSKASNEDPPSADKPAKKALSDADTKQKPDRKPQDERSTEARLQRGIEILRRAGMK